MREQIERIAKRTSVDKATVEFFINEFHHTNMVPVINYLEKRLKALRGDENVKYELEQIRLDFATLSTLAALRNSEENTDKIL